MYISLTKINLHINSIFICKFWHILHWIDTKTVCLCLATIFCLHAIALLNTVQYSTVQYTALHHACSLPNFKSIQQQSPTLRRNREAYNLLIYLFQAGDTKPYCSTTDNRPRPPNNGTTPHWNFSILLLNI
jgi:hypothetical protein